MPTIRLTRRVFLCAALPGLAEVAMDRASPCIDRETDSTRRFRFTLEGTTNTRGARRIHGPGRCICRGSSLLADRTPRNAFRSTRDTVPAAPSSGESRSSQVADAPSKTASRK